VLTGSAVVFSEMAQGLADSTGSDIGDARMPFRKRESDEKAESETAA
jgi:hypothetical protein